MLAIIISILLCILSIMGDHGLSQAINVPFKFEAELLQDSYLPYEPIGLDLSVTNTSEDTLRVRTLSVYTGNLFIVLVDSAGDTLKPTEHRDVAVLGVPGFIIDAGQTYYNCVNLIELFGKGLLHKKLPLGTYKVQAFYGSQTSTQMTFDIEEPKGDDEAAYQLLRAGFNHELAKEPDSAIASFENIVTQFPQSRYAELAYHDLAGSYQVYRGDRNTSDSLDAILIERFPDSYFARGSISRLTNGKTSNERNEFLNGIINKYPGTRSAKFSERKLRGW